MKTLRIAAGPLLLLCAGCFPSTWGFSDPSPPPPPKVEAPLPPVTPERVHGGNAHRIVEVLDQELDRAEREP
jgi:hypothetical protein